MHFACVIHSSPRLDYVKFKPHYAIIHIIDSKTLKSIAKHFWFKYCSVQYFEELFNLGLYKVKCKNLFSLC